MFLSSIVILAKSWTAKSNTNSVFQVQYELNLPNRALYIKRHRQEEKGRTKRGGGQKQSATEGGQAKSREQEKGRSRRSQHGRNKKGEEGEEKQAKQKAEGEKKSPGEPTRRWSPHTNSLYFFCSISIFLPRSSLRQKPASHLPLRRNDHAR